MDERTEKVAKDLYDFGGRTFSKTAIAKFLGISKGSASNLLVGCAPCIGHGTGAKYYYRDVAEAITRGRQDV